MLRRAKLNPAIFRPLHAATYKLHCSSCNVREICLPVGLSREDLEHID